MRRSVRAAPRCVDAPAAKSTEPDRAREPSDWVMLARRMSIPDDHAIRQLVDLAMGRTGGPHPQPPRD